jgi:hypothetical protein
MAPYAELKRVEGLINQAKSVDDIRKVVLKDGPKVGYKAFCYMLGGRMTPEGMKPDEACDVAEDLEQQDRVDEAQVIYKKVAEVHPDHPVAAEKMKEA